MDVYEADGGGDTPKEYERGRQWIEKDGGRDDFEWWVQDDVYDSNWIRRREIDWIDTLPRWSQGGEGEETDWHFVAPYDSVEGDETQDTLSESQRIQAFPRKASHKSWRAIPLIQGEGG